MAEKSGRGRGGSQGGRKGSGSRNLHVKVKTARGRKLSSTRWLQRQLNDPYVLEAKKLGYRSRAAFKLIELDEKFHFLEKGKRVLDLGAAPGGWTQVVVEKVGSTDEDETQVVGLDISEMEPLPGAKIIHMDFMDPEAPERIKQALGGPVDVVLSDMASPATGHPPTDHLRIMGLVEAALEFAYEILAPEGVFIAKVFKGGTENNLLADMKKRFKVVKHAKPPASRPDSAESYVVASGYRGDM